MVYLLTISQNSCTASEGYITFSRISHGSRPTLDKRCQPTQKPALIAAAAALKARLAEEFPTHFAYRILYGADWLLVMADSPIPGLPSEINGVPVEFRAGGTLATTH